MSSSTTDTVMVADLEVMAQANSYRGWMYNQIAPFIGQRVLEVGAGIGNFTELLLDRELVVATDKFQLCVDYLNNRLGNRLQVPAQLLDLGNTNGATFDDLKLDTIICMNVLEHVEHDVEALSFMKSVLVPGGRVVLLVPAFQFLYGTVDRAIEHYRRYTKKDLLPKMEQSGLKIETAFYMNVIGMFGWFWNNRVRKITEENPRQIEFFDRYISPVAERVERVLPPPFGLSLIAIGSK